jgi:hypothetical protein
MAALGQLTAGTANEIKNPLNFVNNFAGLSVELLDELKDAAAHAVGVPDPGERAEIVEAIGMLTENLDRGELIYPNLQREHTAYKYAKQRGERIHSLHVAMNDLRVFHTAS